MFSTPRSSNGAVFEPQKLIRRCQRCKGRVASLFDLSLAYAVNLAHPICGRIGSGVKSCRIRYFVGSPSSASCGRRVMSPILVVALVLKLRYFSALIQYAIDNRHCVSCRYILSFNAWYSVGFSIQQAAVCQRHSTLSSPGLGVLYFREAAAYHHWQRYVCHNVPTCSGTTQHFPISISFQLLIFHFCQAFIYLFTNERAPSLLQTELWSATKSSHTVTASVHSITAVNAHIRSSYLNTPLICQTVILLCTCSTKTLIRPR